MPVEFQQYCKEAGITEDYYRVRDFFLELGDPDFSFGRWDWMITHSSLDRQAVQQIGLWKDAGRVVGIATFDCQPGESFVYTLDGYQDLKREMLGYAYQHLRNIDGFRVMISDRDTLFQQVAVEEGYIATPNKDMHSVYPIPDWQSIEYTLPAGFQIVSMEERCDLYQYGRVLWNGFNHEQNGEGPFNPTEATMAQYQQQMCRPNVNLAIKIAVVDPNGSFVSYCGMWQDPRSSFCEVEPAATDPAYRKMGLGKAAVLEGIRRCGQLGARQAYVGSNQQFYYSIGFRPATTSTWWIKKA